MVYNGVPSRGCYLCRSRKIKCDETKPFCNRCRKSERQCPGYPIVIDASTRPQTGRYKAAKKKGADTLDGSHTYEDEDHSSKCWMIQASQRAGVSPPVYLTIKMPFSDAASCHLLSNWVLLPPEGTDRGFFKFLLPIQNKATHGSPFYLAFKACSFASLAQQGFDPLIHRRAASYYIKALAATSSALSRPSVATNDTTLATVLLLALYEIQTATTKGGWGSHVIGSVQLMNSRSWRKLKSDIGMGLFAVVRVNLILLGMLTGAMIPTTLDWWGQGTFKDKHAFIGFQMAAKSTELQNELNTLLDLESATLADLNKVSALMERVQALAEHCRVWPESLPKYFRFYLAAQVNEMPSNLAEAQALQGPVHGYSGPWVAAVWSMVRNTHLICSILVARCLAILHQRTDVQMLPEYLIASQTCAGVIKEIISSVPYHLGWFKNRTSLLSELPCFAYGDNGMESSLSAFFILFPLVTIKNLDFATKDQREWAKGRLYYIAHYFGLQTALFAGQVDGMAPSTKIAQDYESLSARLWRRQGADPAPVTKPFYAGENGRE